MAWTAPVDYSTGDIITASIFNNLLGASGNIIETAGGKVTTAGDLVYGTAANAVSRLGIGSADEILAVNSAGSAPEWVENAPAASDITGLTADTSLFVDSAAALGSVALGASGTIFTSAGATSDPTWSANAPAATDITGWGNDKVLYTSGSGNLQELALGSSGEVLTSNGPIAAPTFAAAGGGGAWECIAASNTSTSFSSTTPASVLSFTGLTIDPGEWFVVVGRAYTSAPMIGYEANIWLNPTSSSATAYYLSPSANKGTLLCINTYYAQAGWFWFMGCVSKGSSSYSPYVSGGGAEWTTLGGTNSASQHSYDSWAAQNMASQYNYGGGKKNFYYNEQITALDIFANVNGGQLSGVESVYVYKLATSV
jgi:hypothetical protein